MSYQGPMLIREPELRWPVILVAATITTLIVLATAGVIHLALTSPAVTPAARPRLEGALRPGMPAFEQSRKQMLVEQVVVAEVLRPTDEAAVEVRATLRNTTGRMRGDPRWLITMEARKWPADLILIRAHNRADFRSWMLGRVAKSVVREAPCSVEVVRAAGEDLKVTGNGHMRILLATDGSAHAVAAAGEVAECPWPEGTQVKVMSIVSPVLYSLEEIGLFDGGGTDRAHRAISDAAQILQGAGLKTAGEVIAGRPEKRITHEAGEWGADLVVVVGTRDSKGLGRLISGSVSEAVASRAPCSVKVVRVRDKDSRRGKL